MRDPDEGAKAGGDFLLFLLLLLLPPPLCRPRRLALL